MITDLILKKNLRETEIYFDTQRESRRDKEQNSIFRENLRETVIRAGYSEKSWERE